ncbi:MAG: helix-turn-helix transcriptional regulator [Lachnospiraceae bacterium]|nr:helix-turn-helix transcriptional regulator [Lachnospiraceae bacterium]
MTVYYSRPVLKSLAQGDRVAFIRKFRRISQQQLGDALGMDKGTARNRICRIERTSRQLKPDRLAKVADALHVNPMMLRWWDFKNPEDLFYHALWVEELCPDFQFRYSIAMGPQNPTHKVFKEKYIKWKVMRRRYIDGRISLEEYWEWKLTQA